MAIDDREPVASQRIVFESSHLVNIHVIENRVYYVYAHSLCVSGCVITRFESQISASCICGPTIAILLRSGHLVVPHPDTLLYTDSKGMCVEPIGMPSHKLFRRKLAATSSGSYIALNLTKTSILIYKFEANVLSFCRTINVAKRGAFQLTGDTNPYLWHLYTNGETYIIDLFEANELSPVCFPDVPVARCPIMIEGPVPKSFDDSSCRLHACQMTRMEGILFIIEGTLFHLGLKSAVIGDLVSGLTKYPSKWFSSICTSYSSSGTQFYSCSREDFKIVKIEEDGRNGSEQEPILTERFGKVPFHLRSERDLHFAVVAYRDDENEFNAHGSKNIKDVIFEPFSSGKVRDFALDVRKLPRKVLQLGALNLELRAVVTLVKLSTKKLGRIKARDVFYIQELDMLLITSCHDNRIKVLTGVSRPTTESSGLVTFSDSTFALDDLVAVGVIRKHTLALVSPHGIRLHSAMAPHKLIGWVSNFYGLAILDASCTDFGVVIRSVDSVALVYVEPKAMPLKLINGITTSFISFMDDKIYVGLDISFSRSRKLYEKLATGSGVTVQTEFLKDSSRKVGVIAVFDVGGAQPKLVSLSVHSYVPTGVYQSATSPIDSVFYGLNGTVGHLFHETQKVTYTSIGQEFKWIGVQDDAVLISCDAGLILVTTFGCQPLIESSRPAKVDQISSGAIINNEILALISKQELKFVATPKIKGSRPTALLKRMQLPRVPHNLKLKMLPVSSQRLLLLHGENICMFYDSLMFEQILVTGITAVWCENILLWKFKSGGEWYEHLVFVDDRGWIESYSFRRDGLTLECSCKYRAAIFNNIMRQKSSEILHCSSSALYVSRGEHLVAVVPGINTVRHSTKVPNEIKCLSHTKDHLFVSTAQELLVLTVGNLAVVAKINVQNIAPIVANSSHSLRNLVNQTLMIDMMDVSGKKRELVSHVACTIERNDAADVVYVLCGLSCPGEERQHLSLVQFDPSNLALKCRGPSTYDRPGLRLEAVIKLKADPESDPEVSHSTLRAYAVTTDHGISLIEVAPRGRDSLNCDFTL